VCLGVTSELTKGSSNGTPVAYSALEPELFCKLLFRKDGDPYLPGTTAQAQAVRLGRRPLVCLGVTSELTKGSSNGNGRSPHSWRQYAASPAMRSRKLGNGFFLWVRATPLFLCRLHARRHQS
jgi:hypothetical protein